MSLRKSPPSQPCRSHEAVRTDVRASAKAAPCTPISSSSMAHEVRIENNRAERISGVITSKAQVGQVWLHRKGLQVWKRPFSAFQIPEIKTTTLIFKQQVSATETIQTDIEFGEDRYKDRAHIPAERFEQGIDYWINV